MERFQAKRIALRMCNLRGVVVPSEEIEETTSVLLASQIGHFPFDIVDATLTVVKSERDVVTPRHLVRACLERPVTPNRPSLPAPEDSSGVASRPIYWPERSNGREPFIVAQPDEQERERLRYFYAAAALPASVVHRPDLGIAPHHIARADAVRRRAAADLEEKLDHFDRPDGGELNAMEQSIVEDAQARLAELRHALGHGKSDFTKSQRLLASSLARIGSRMVADGRISCAGCGKTDLDAQDVDGAVRALIEAGARGALGGHVYCEHCRSGKASSMRWTLDPTVGLPPEELERLIEEERRALHRLDREH